MTKDDFGEIGLLFTCEIVEDHRIRDARSID